MLVLKPGKNGVRFEYSDDDTETAIYIDKADIDEDMVRKLKRVIALVEGEPAPEYRLHQPKHPALDAVNPATGNGWAAVYGPPALPERLQGEVELVQPEEGA